MKGCASCSKGHTWEVVVYVCAVTAAMWGAIVTSYAFIATMCTVAATMWDVEASIWDVIASAHYVHLIANKTKFKVQEK